MASVCSYPRRTFLKLRLRQDRAWRLTFIRQVRTGLDWIHIVVTLPTWTTS